MSEGADTSVCVKCHFLAARGRTLLKYEFKKVVEIFGAKVDAIIL